MIKSKFFTNPISLLLLIFFISIEPAMCEENPWVISDIRLSGLQRVSAGSVFAEMPIAVGDSVDTYDLQIIAKTLFKTGQFDDIQIGRDGNI